MEVRRGLLTVRHVGLSEVMGGRKEDGSVAEGDDEQQQEQMQSALQSLKPESDEFGRQLQWHFTFRRRKRLAREASEPTASSTATGMSPPWVILKHQGKSMNAPALPVSRACSSNSHWTSLLSLFWV